MAEVQLQTERLILRPFQAQDRSAIAEMQSDPRVMGWLGSGIRPWPRADVEALGWIEGWGIPSANLATLAVAERETGAFLGMIFLGAIPGDEVQLGYRFRHSAWGQGYATEAAGRLLRYGFEELGLARVFAYTRQDNRGSANVLRKIGMREHGRWIVSGFHVPVFVARP